MPKNRFFDYKNPVLALFFGNLTPRTPELAISDPPRPPPRGGSRGVQIPKTPKSGLKTCFLQNFGKFCQFGHLGGVPPNWHIWPIRTLRRGPQGVPRGYPPDVPNVSPGHIWGVPGGCPKSAKKCPRGGKKPYLRHIWTHI